MSRRRLLRTTQVLPFVFATMAAGAAVVACSGTDSATIGIDGTPTEPGESSGASGASPGASGGASGASGTSEGSSGASGSSSSGSSGSTGSTGSSGGGSSSGGPDASADAASLDGGDAGAADAADAAKLDPCDRDGDGVRGPQCAGGTDCDDDDPLTRPGVAESDDWTVQTIASESRSCPTCASGAQLTAWRFWDVAMALAPDGTARVAMVWNDPASAKLVLYTETAGGTFTTEVVAALDATGKGNPAIAVDSAGKVHIAYIRSPSAMWTNAGTLRYATNASGAWAFSDIDELWDGHAPLAFHVEPGGVAHFAYVPKRAGAPASLEHARRALDGAIAREVIDSRAPSEIALAHDGTRLRAMFLAGGLYSADATAAGGWSVGAVAAIGQPGRSLVLAAGSPGTVHAAHFDATTAGLLWTRGAALGLTTTPVIDLDPKIAQRPGVAARATRTDFLMNGKPPGWNIPFVVQVSQQAGTWRSDRFDLIGDCTTERCRLPLVARGDGALRGAAIGHFLNGATKRWEDVLHFYRRPPTDGIDRACNGE